MTHPEPPLPVQPGDVLAGKYQVEKVLGSGGMGMVVLATHLELAQKVALKFLLPHALQRPESAARFLREARAAVKIQSEHVARVIDVGRLEDGAPYMVMEYLEGEDLSNHPHGESLPVEDAVDFVMQACEAMAVAHTAGIIHRDLKPANLFLARRPDGSAIVKVLDFGISKVSELDQGNAALTQTSAVMGSPLYMSPEQMKSSRNVDARTDIWSLGAILYELLGGAPPFNGETLGEVFAGVMTAEPPPLRERRPDVSQGLERIVLRALRKNPAERFSNVAELSAALLEFAPRRSRVLAERASAVLNRAGVAAPAIRETSLAPRGPAPDAAVAGATNTSWEDAPAIPRTSRRPLVLGAVVVVGFAALGVLFALHGGGTPAISTEAQPTVAPPTHAAVAPPATEHTEVAPAPEPPHVSVEPAVAPSSSAPAPHSGPASARPPRSSPIQPAATAPPSTPPPATAVAPRPAAPPAPVPAPAAPPLPKKNPLNIEFK